MKYMNMRKKHLPMNLQLFAEGGDGGSDGDDSGDGDDQDDDDSDKDGEGEDKKIFSQKDIDEAVKARLAREKRKWQRQQQKPEDKPGETGAASEETEADKKAREAEEKAAALELKWTCLEHNVKKDCVDDVLALARVHVSRDSSLDVEDAIDKVLEKYPQFKDGYDDEDEEGEKKKGWGQRHDKPPKKSTTVDDEIRKQLFGK